MALDEEIRARSEQLAQLQARLTDGFHDKLRGIAYRTNRTRFQKMNFHRVVLADQAEEMFSQTLHDARELKGKIDSIRTVEVVLDRQMLGVRAKSERLKKVMGCLQEEIAQQNLHNSTAC